MIDPELTWSDGPFGDKEAEFAAALEMVEPVAEDTTIPITQQTIAALSLAKLVDTNRSEAVRWLGDVEEQIGHPANVVRLPKRYRNSRGEAA